MLTKNIDFKNFKSKKVNKKIFSLLQYVLKENNETNLTTSATVCDGIGTSYWTGH